MVDKRDDEGINRKKGGYFVEGYQGRYRAGGGSLRVFYSASHQVFFGVMDRNCMNPARAVK